MTEGQKALIRYRLEMARATLRDAMLLRQQGGSLWSVVNRAYYAMFYATLALLVWLGKGSPKHSGVLALFDKHLVKTGHFPRSMSKWFHKAFDLRQIGDYRELVTLSVEQVDEVVRWAGEFVAEAERFLEPKLTED